MSADPVGGHGTIDLIVGAAFVLLYSGHRFNTPPTNRSSTTAGRFFLALGCYGLAAVGTYVLLVKSPHLITLLSGADPKAVPDLAKELSSPLLVALLMTTLLPKLPLLSAVDGWMLDRLKSLAAIPYEVLRLSAQLKRQAFTVSPELEREVRRVLKAEDFEESDVRFDPGDSPAQIWTRLTALIIQLEAWESDRRMAGYMVAYGADWTSARERHEAMKPKARTCFRLLRESAAGNESDKAREAADQYADDFAEHAKEIYLGLLDFISRGVLYAEMTDTARQNRLVALGFPGGGGPPIGLTLNQLLSLFGVVGILMLSTFVLSSPTPNTSHGTMVARAIMVSVIYSVAVACVMLPKQRWAFARCEPGQARPVAFYLVAGLMAVAITQLISFGFNWALVPSLSDAKQRYLLTYPWSMMTFTTAVLTGFLVDDRPRPEVPRLIWRSFEGLSGAAVMFGAALLTYRWLTELSGGVQFEVMRSLDYTIPPLGSVLGTAATVGFAIGWLVPTWYREAPRIPAALHVTRLIEAH